ncbi:MAG: DUF5009 domain-containing protein [Candidatus Marinimicrobia bacterium]|nr:DUF5009 domain-containing protein [Candidatus Neomarinimicrobiota bacterium]
MDNSIKVSERVRSIDIFRGLTILLMIFVNDVAGVRNIPGWLKHAEPGSPGMTFVDVVFRPSFSLWAWHCLMPLPGGKKTIP